jgi:hypothetical protein
MAGTLLDEKVDGNNGLQSVPAAELRAGDLVTVLEPRACGDGSLDYSYIGQPLLVAALDRPFLLLWMRSCIGYEWRQERIDIRGRTFARMPVRLLKEDEGAVFEEKAKEIAEARRE